MFGVRVMVMFTHEVEGQKIQKAMVSMRRMKNFQNSQTDIYLEKRWSCCELPGEKSLIYQ